MIDIKGRRAFLTGASRGIGRQIAIGLADLGCHLIIHARKKENLEATLKQLEGKEIEVAVVEAELSDLEQVKSMLETIDGMDRQVDIVYNCAAISQMDSHIYDTSMEKWQLQMQVNVYALIKICEHFLPGLIDRGFGRIVNVSSGIADQPALVAYSVTKAVVDRYSRDFAPSLKEKGVLINTIDPGWIQTDMGGPNATATIESVLPGMLVPVLLDQDGPAGCRYSAQYYCGKALDEIDYGYDGFKLP